MHTFTKQQRQGGPRYQSRTLVGNWSEELELYATNMKSFLEQRRMGTLKTDRHSQKLQTGLCPVQLAGNMDGPSSPGQEGGACVRFGTVMQLAHAHTGAVLAVDVEDKDARPGVEACAASASADPRSQAPVARSTFLLAKLPREQHSALEPQWWGDEVLRYGQKVRLLANPMAQGEELDGSGGSQPLALYSCPVSPTCVARSRHQLVGFSWRQQAFDTVWQVQPLDPAETLAAEGQPVLAGVPVLLVHCATQAPLAIDAGDECGWGLQREAGHGVLNPWGGVPHPNDFGIELGVSCHAETSHGKQLNLEHTARGDDLRTLPKAKLGSNHWVFVVLNANAFPSTPAKRQG